MTNQTRGRDSALARGRQRTTHGRAFGIVRSIEAEHRSATGFLPRVAAAAGVLGVVSGLAQVLRPDAVLAFMGARLAASEALLFCFAVIGAFIALFDGLLLHVMASQTRAASVALLWVALEKLTYAAAVGIGVARGLFAPAALLLVAFGAAAGAATLAYYRRRASLPAS